MISIPIKEGHKTAHALQLSGHVASRQHCICVAFWDRLYLPTPLPFPASIPEKHVRSRLKLRAPSCKGLLCGTTEDGIGTKRRYKGDRYTGQPLIHRVMYQPTWSGDTQKQEPMAEIIRTGNYFSEQLLSFN